MPDLSEPVRGRPRRAAISAPTGKWVSLAPGASHDLAITGAGVLRRLWCVFNAEGRPAASMAALVAHPEFYRDIWMHIAFDDTGEVQVSAPVADFFLLGHGEIVDVDSAFFQVVRIPPLDAAPYQGALTCLAPMPFAECAKLSFVNRHPFPIRMIAGIDWLERDDRPEPVRHFHATFTQRRRHVGPMVILDRRQCEGTFAGLSLYVNNPDETSRWHEGAERFEVDGRRPALVGTGAEDYFSLAWGFRRTLTRAHFGVTCARPRGGHPSLPSGTFNPAGEFAMYRFHVHDPIPFARALRLSFRGGGAAPLAYRAIAYWYGRRLHS